MADAALLIVADYRRASGGRGIRTPGDLTATTVFKTVAIVHSAIPPHSGAKYSRLEHDCQFSEPRSGGSIAHWSMRAMISAVEPLNFEGPTMSERLPLGLQLGGRARGRRRRCCARPVRTRRRRSGHGIGLRCSSDQPDTVKGMGPSLRNSAVGESEITWADMPPVSPPPHPCRVAAPPARG